MLVVIRKNGKLFRTLPGFYAPDVNIPLHALRAVAPNHEELKESLVQQELCASNQGYTWGDVYVIEWGPATTIRTPQGTKAVGWAGGTWSQEV